MTETTCPSPADTLLSWLQGTWSALEGTSGLVNFRLCADNRSKADRGLAWRMVIKWLMWVTGWLTLVTAIVTNLAH